MDHVLYRSSTGDTGSGFHQNLFSWSKLGLACFRLLPPLMRSPLTFFHIFLKSSCICVAMMIVFVILVHSELKKWLNPIKICVDYSNWIHLSSAWAYYLTVIVIGLWISSVIILLCYPFWGEQVLYYCMYCLVVVHKVFVGLVRNQLC